MRTKEGILFDVWHSDKHIDEDELSDECIYKAMDEYAKEVAIDTINFLKRQGVNWNINNASTPAEQLFNLYLQETGHGK